LPAKTTLDLLIGTVSSSVAFPKSHIIFGQGDPADTVFYIEEGKVRLTVISTTGKEAIIAILGGGDFFGEGSLAGQPLRMESATAMMDCRILRIKKDAMSLALRREPKIADLFMACVLARNIQYEENFVDQLFNSSEKRLARILLLLARFGGDGNSETAIPDMSQAALAEMVGTTRSRINVFMNKFRASGFIAYGKDGIRVHSSLLSIVLKE
jgi:CRP/FNR family transcriptional regulator, cyclic AMP receptor protein